MSESNPIDYLVVGVLRALYDFSPSSSINHTLTYENISLRFKNHYDLSLSNNAVSYLIKRMENLGVANVILDPYADTIVEVSDSSISQFIATSEIPVLQRGWANDEWLRSAYRNNKLWHDIDGLLDSYQDIELIPSADGFVTVNHNSAEFVETESLIEAADEAIRGDNEIEDDEQKGWIRVHIHSGIDLLRRGGPVLKAALLALIVEPLKAAMKATANENVKKLVTTALSAILKWLI